jgi:maleylacetoacetate isomerase
MASVSTTGSEGGVKRARSDGSSTQPEKPILYGYWRSTTSWRVRLGLEFKRIAYDTRSVHLVKNGGEQWADDYAKRNPMRQVPTLEIDGACLAQSMAILEYLEDSRTGYGTSLLPENLIDRALARNLANIIACDTHPVQNLRVLLRVAELTPGDDAVKGAAKKAWGHKVIVHAFDAYEAILQSSAGKFSVGDEVSVADVCLVPQVYNGQTKFGIDMSKYPTMKRVHDALIELPEFKAAHPDNQPDAVQA